MLSANLAGVSGAACQADLSSAALLLASKLCRQSENDEGQPAMDGRRSKKRVFEKGNYNRYYGYRLGQGETQDSRLKVCILGLHPDSASRSCITAC